MIPPRVCSAFRLCAARCSCVCETAAPVISPSCRAARMPSTSVPRPAIRGFPDCCRMPAAALTACPIVAGAPFKLASVAGGGAAKPCLESRQALADTFSCPCSLRTERSSHKRLQNGQVIFAVGAISGLRHQPSNASISLIEVYFSRGLPVVRPRAISASSIFFQSEKLIWRTLRRLSIS